MATTEAENDGLNLVPDELLHLINEKIKDETFGSQPWIQDKPYYAAVLFADISGFSGLKLKPNEVVDVMKQCQETIVNVIYGCGGDVISFAGDAALAVFKGDVKNACENAARAGLILTTYGVDASFQGKQSNYKVHAGMAFGQVQFCTLGCPGNWRFLAIGEAVLYATKTEPVAEECQLACHVSALGHLDIKEQPKEPNAGRLNDFEERDVLILNPKELDKFSATDLVADRHFNEVSSEVKKMLLDFVPVDIQEGPGLGVVSFSRLNHLLTPGSFDKEKSVVADLVGKIAEVHGATLRIILDDKGLGILACFRTTQENKEKIVNLAQKILNDADRFHSGATYSEFYAGIIGGSQRAEYTVHGSEVNKAARFMGAAVKYGNRLIVSPTFHEILAAKTDNLGTKEEIEIKVGSEKKKQEVWVYG